MNKLYILLLLLVTSVTYAQYRDQDIERYIAKYKDKAIAEQNRTGVPASITLAQGIYETGAGTSELCVNANNHFGIKCKNTWKGKTYTYTDDAKDECFRAYDNWEQSYVDHSDFLRNNKRYDELFQYSIHDYKAWSHGLQKAGYATNTQYATKLINLIERYNLHSYSSAPSVIDSDNLSSTTSSLGINNEYRNTNDDTLLYEEAYKLGYYKITKLHGLPGFLARKGDNLLEYSVKNRIRYARLLEVNELKDEPLPYDMFIYLERKNNRGSRSQVTVQTGETIHFISQREGMLMSVIRALNHLLPNEEPASGQVLELINQATSKPSIEIRHNNDKIKEEDSNINITTESKSEFVSKSDIEHKSDLFPKQRNERIAETVSQQIPLPIDSMPYVQNHRANDESMEKSTTTNNNEVSSLDKMKQRFDQTIYGSSQEYNSGTKVESKEYLKVSQTTNKSISTVQSLNKPASSVKSSPSSAANNSSSAQERLNNHMKQKGKSNTAFTPKATGLDGNTSGSPTKRSTSSSTVANPQLRQSSKSTTPKSSTSTTKKKATDPKNGTAKPINKKQKSYAKTKAPVTKKKK